MLKLIFIISFSTISLFQPNESYAQENLISNSESAALTGASPQVGVAFGGVSIANVTLLTVVITSLVAFALQDSDTTASTASTN